MNREALTRHDIYTKLTGLPEKDLDAIVHFIENIRDHNQLEFDAPLKLEGILKGYDINPDELKDFRKQTWEHVEEEQVHE